MPYVPVYEITHESFLWSWRFPFLALTVIYGLFATIFLLGTRHWGCLAKVARYLVVLFACLWAMLVAYNFRSNARYVQAYKAGDFSVVEGRVEEYSWKGKTECFKLRGVEFCRGTASPGLLGWPIGLIQKGLPVRIAYAEGEYRKILRLEIAN